MVGKPKNEVAMSSTERSRQYRERKKQQGKREVNLVFSERAIEKLDEVVEVFNLPSRSVAVAQLLEVPLDNAIVSMQGLKDSPEFAELMALEGEAEELWSKIRKAMWAAICSQDKKARDDLYEALQKIGGE
jgi:hypothetical protein